MVSFTNTAFRKKIMFFILIYSLISIVILWYFDKWKYRANYYNTKKKKIQIGRKLKLSGQFLKYKRNHGYLETLAITTHITNTFLLLFLIVTQSSSRWILIIFVWLRTVKIVGIGTVSWIKPQIQTLPFHRLKSRWLVNSFVITSKILTWMWFHLIIVIIMF